MSQGLLLSTAAVFAVTLLVGVLGATAFRVGTRPLGFWLFAWSAHLFAAGLMLVNLEIPAIRPVVFLFSALVAPLMLSGAFEHVRRTAPIWPLALGIALGAFRITAYQLDAIELGRSAAILIEPGLGLAAAFVIGRSKSGGARSRGDVLLTTGFGLYAACEAIDVGLRFTTYSNWTIWGVWLALGMPLFATQVALYISRLGRSAQAERRQAVGLSERLRIFTKSADVSLVEFDRYGNLTYMSPNAPPLAGGTLEDFLGRNVSEVFPTTLDSVIKEALAERGYVTEEDIRRAEIQTQRSPLPSGEIVYYEAHRTAYHTPDGELRVLTQARDVTERVEAEQAIRESERRLKRAEQIGQFGSWEHDARTGTTHWSDHLHRLHGLEPKPGPIELESALRLVNTDALTEMTTSAYGLSGGQSFPAFQYTIQRADDGETRHFRTMGDVEYDDAGKVVRLSGATIDVTEQRALEDALRRGREYLDALVNANIVGVFYGALDGSMRDANSAFLDLVGHRPDELPLDWRALTPPEGHARDDAAIIDLIETGTALPYEKEFLTKEGEKVPVLIACAQIEEDSAIAIVLDQRERKRNEALVARQQRVLEETVSERTRELLDSRTRLEEAQRLAAVGTLAAGVAHQINNPIGAILNTAEYALLCADDESALRIFHEALSSNLTEAQRCARIVKSMLQFSRDEPTEKWNDDLDRVIRHAHRAIAAYAQDRDAIVSLNLPDEPIRVWISPIEIEQAIVNVLRNAIESRDRGAKIEVVLRKISSESGSQAELSITDDGVGIESTERARLFEPFYSTRTREGGTGLGLSVAHGVITDHGGEIRVESTRERGTRVLISLPTSTD